MTSTVTDSDRSRGHSPADELRLLHVLEPAIAGVPAYVDKLGGLLADAGVHQTVLMGGRSQLEHWAFEEWADVVDRPRWSRRSLDTFRISRSLADLVDGDRINLVHAHSTFAGIACRLPKLPVPVLYQPHGWGIGSASLPLVGASIRLVERLLARRADRLLLLSDHEEAEAPAGVLRDRVGPMVDLTAFEPLPQDRVNEIRAANGWLSFDHVHLCVGELSARKNQVALAKAWQRLGPAGHLLVFVGDGSTMPEVVEFSGDRIRVVGWRKDIAELMGGADSLIVASRAEGFALVMVEALASGLPVFSTPVGGSEAIDASDGVVASDLDELVRSAVSSPLITATHHDKVRRSSTYRTRFSPDAMARRILDLYLDVVNLGPALPAVGGQ